MCKKGHGSVRINCDDEGGLEVMARACQMAIAIEGCFPRLAPLPRQLPSKEDGQRAHSRVPAAEAPVWPICGLFWNVLLEWQGCLPRAGGHFQVRRGLAGRDPQNCHSAQGPLEARPWAWFDIYGLKAVWGPLEGPIARGQLLFRCWGRGEGTCANGVGRGKVACTTEVVQDLNADSNCPQAHALDSSRYKAMRAIRVTRGFRRLRSFAIPGRMERLKKQTSYGFWGGVLFAVLKRAKPRKRSSASYGHRLRLSR